LPGRVISNESSSDADREIQHGAIRCESCGIHYDIVWGAPFLGAFDDRDIVGLIEIAANARADNGYIDAATIRRLEHLLVKYHGSRDRTAFVRDEPDEMVRAPWFLNRYNEWLHFTTITAGISFAGRRVLDVGAGTGVDSYRIVAAGGNVTALEYNPMLVRRGLSAVPEVRWFGGLSHALPFIDGSFDIVCCNAALHHMRDVATSLEEMVRVLRPGGWLITTGDPYRARHLGEDHELAVFNRHPAVLLGINESIPSFIEFESALHKHRSKLNIRILTDGLHPAQSGGRRRRLRQISDAAKAIKHFGTRILSRRTTRDSGDGEIANSLQWWDFDRDHQTLGNSSGSIALRCRARKGIAIPPHCHGEMVLSAGEYAESLTDYQRAIQKLAPHVPADYVNCPFPGEAQSKFALLNGWLAPDGGRARSAYRRARWFLRRPVQMDNLSFSVRYPTVSLAEPVSINVFVNGVNCLTVQLTSDWHDVALPVSQISPDEIFVVEIQLTLEPATFDDGIFEVQDLHLS
jgi:ubiquinone/menaquinone biosynthesis C-methylase UbiE